MAAGESWNIAGEVCYARCMMRGLHDIAGQERPEWEPEALHVPSPERADDPRSRRNQSDDAGDDDLPGSHVIVIDLA